MYFFLTLWPINFALHVITTKMYLIALSALWHPMLRVSPLGGHRRRGRKTKVRSVEGVNGRKLTKT
jgi:hypothetical protein